MPESTYRQLMAWSAPALRIPVPRQVQFRPTRLPRLAWALATPAVHEQAAALGRALGIAVSYDELMYACEHGHAVTLDNQVLHARPSSQRGIYLLQAEVA